MLKKFFEWKDIVASSVTMECKELIYIFQTITVSLSAFISYVYIYLFLKLNQILRIFITISMY